MQKQKRGFTLIELLVVIAIIGVLAAILIPNLMDAIAGAGKGPDRSNLANLMESYLAGQAGATGQSKPVPGSTGHEFWLALFVGDGPNTNLEVRDHESPNIYLRARSANLLRSPADDGVRSREAIERAIQDAIDDEAGVSGLGPDYVSYAGPKGYGSGNSPRIALQTNRNRSGLVGCTGSRGEVGFFHDGFNAVDQDASAQFYTYSNLAEEQDYPSDATRPLYEENILEWVEDFEAVQ